MLLGLHHLLALEFPLLGDVLPAYKALPLSPFLVLSLALLVEDIFAPNLEDPLQIGVPILRLPLVEGLAQLNLLQNLFSVSTLLPNLQDLLDLLSHPGELEGVNDPRVGLLLNLPVVVQDERIEDFVLGLPDPRENEPHRRPEQPHLLE